MEIVSALTYGIIRLVISSLGQFELGSLADWISGVGSLAAVIVALYLSQDARREHLEDRRAAEKSVAYEIMAVVRDVSNNVLALERHLGENRNFIQLYEGATKERYRLDNPLMGISSEGAHTLPAGATELFAKAGASDLWNETRELVDRNRSLTAITLEYRALWASATAKIPPRRIGDNSSDRACPNSAELREELINIDMVLGQFEDQLNDTAGRLKALMPEIGPRLRQYVGGPFLTLDAIVPTPNSDQPKEPADQ
jgi:hypothetical protein